MVPPSAPLKLMLRYTALPKALLGRTSAPLAQEGKWITFSVVLCNKHLERHGAAYQPLRDKIGFVSDGDLHDAKHA